MPIFPVSSLDPFSDDFLAAPYPFYAELREAGPVVWLERYGLWACARHAEVQAALSDWPSDERQVQADMRTHLIHRPARDIIPPLSGARLSSYRV